MPTDLYLDTARFGLVVPAAQGAQVDFARLCGKEGGSAHIDEFLREGTEAWPASMRGCYSGLAAWRGVAQLKESLGHLAGAPARTPVLLANRSAELMKLAARALFRRCGSVLCTDLEWPGYLAILDAERRRGEGCLVCFAAREACFRQGLQATEFVRSVASRYRREQCEGLFLSAVSFEGVRLPVAQIVASLSDVRPPRFVVVDGAQALAHVPGDLPACDVYLAGCHKWLGAGHPLGLAFHPRPSSQEYLRNLANEMVINGDLEDPLLLFAAQLENHRLEPFSETVSFAGLFSCAAAAAANLADPLVPATRLQSRLANADAVAEAARPSGWEPLLPDTPFRSGILLLQGRAPGVRAAPAEEVRAGFQRHGVAVTTYPEGVARVSLPPRPWEGRELDQLRSTLRSCA
ncbi:MAG TPA: aminotransferase class V-fold PLP-dependent enzyme [Gemmataceae bacterium]|nr:aminotransferase class V-fold PLP-dependent enzyme [Gemmataceae bacterium]